VWLGPGIDHREKSPAGIGSIQGDKQHRFASIVNIVSGVFGVDRCMFEGNFPVEKVATARRFYRLD
jgi:predicted TIM-barrel fold metal-dependent hydrolase